MAAAMLQVMLVVCLSAFVLLQHGTPAVAALQASASQCSGPVQSSTSSVDYSTIVSPLKSSSLLYKDVPGFTRSTYSSHHALIAPESRVFVPQPGWTNVMTAHLVSSGMGAHFSMYLAILAKNSSIPAPEPGVERFVFILHGSVDIEGGAKAAWNGTAADFVYQPAGDAHRLTSAEGGGAVIYERKYSFKMDTKPEFQFGSTETQPLVDVAPEVFKLRKLLPTLEQYDFNIHIMDFNPGEYLFTKEVHWNQHGLLMLSGQGVYRLNDDWYPVQSGDAIWMAPFVPQWFGALGTDPSDVARYILYKDLSRSTLP